MGLIDTRETKVGVLDKAIALLLVFSSGELSLTPQDLAQRTDLPLPTVYRLAQALCEHGLLAKEGSRFRLGMTLFRLGMLVAEGIDVRRQALPHLKWLNVQTNENAELHIRQDEARLVVEVVSSPHNLRPFAAIGAPLPLHRGAAAKVLLAWLNTEQCTALIDASVRRCDDHSSFDKAVFMAELDRVRSQGWASSDSERFAGVSAIAAPIFAAGGVIAGVLTLVAPSARLGDEQRERYTPLVREAARRASYDLGFTEHR